jgi:ATP-binding cassette, subfamily B, bacterial
MGFFEGLDAEKYDRTYSDRMLIDRIIYYFKPQWKRMLVVIVAVVVMAGLGAFQPVVVSRGVDAMKQTNSWRIYLIPLAVFAIGFGS